MFHLQMFSLTIMSGQAKDITSIPNTFVKASQWDRHESETRTTIVQLKSIQTDWVDN